MSLMPKQNGNHSIEKNSIVFYEGQENTSLNILLQGKIEVYISPYDIASLSEEEVIAQSYKVFDIDQNIILGANDLFISKNHSFSYRALTDSTLFVYSAQDVRQIKNLVDYQKDYAAYLITSIASIISNAFPAYLDIKKLTETVQTINDNLVMTFWHMKERYNINHVPTCSFFSDGLEKLRSLEGSSFSFPLGFSVSFFETPHIGYNNLYKNPLIDDLRLEAEYYNQFLNIPLDIRKSFFASDFNVTVYHCRKAAQTLDKINTLIKNTLAELDDYFNRLYSMDGDCILKEFLAIAEEMKASGSDISGLVMVVRYISSKTKELSDVISNSFQHLTNIDFDYLDGIINLLDMSSSSVSPTETLTEIEILEEGGYIPEELKSSAEKILEYSEISKEKADLFRGNLHAFRNLKDKSASSEDLRQIRLNISSVFFEIYMSVFKKSMEEKNTSRLIYMFLYFSYMDEKLLEPGCILELYKFAGSLESYEQPSVFTMGGWLTEIYDSRRNPSVNEFGQDYDDIFRDLKKRGEIRDSDKDAYDNNTDAKLKHEIFNMFRINHRICHGHPGSYFPILHQDMFLRNPAKAIITPELLKERIDKILEVDFSAFHREVFYTGQKKGFEKELIMKSITPDFILMPIFGSRAIMWQEIAGRNRNTPGRLILPIFTSENIDDMLIKLIGNFRWELCRTMMGTSWNDITQSSLTSDYSDYIQFFKKNRELSDEAKEKVKAQIQKYNNKLRDIFTADYEYWINYEAKGILRLNKVARGILYKHCPFNKDIRSFCERQPAYNDIAPQFNNIRSKKAKELDNRYKMLMRSGMELDPEIEENLRFYKDL